MKWRTWGNVKWLLAEVYDQPWLPGLKAKPREDQAHGRKWPPALERCLHFSVRTVHVCCAQEHNSGEVSTLFRAHCAPAHLPSWAETLLNVTVHNQVSIDLSIQITGTLISFVWNIKDYPRCAMSIIGIRIWEWDNVLMNHCYSGSVYGNSHCLPK